MNKGVPTIFGSCETDIGSAAIKNTAYLESRDNSIAKGKGIGLDFSLVLTELIVERVATELNEGFTCRLCRRGMGESSGRVCEGEGK